MFEKVLAWSEVWALLIPLTIWLIKRPAHKWVRPVIVYIMVALLLNTTADLIWQRKHLGIDGWMQQHLSFFYEKDGTTFKNTLLYNLHSIFRMLLFAWFFHYLGRKFQRLNFFLPGAFLIFIIINFTVAENIKDFSSWLLAVEAALLLFYCLQYYLSILKEERTDEKRPASFWVVTGLSIYVVINFPIFLFYINLARQFKNFAVNLWDVHNISYIIFCIFIAKAFYEPKQ